jgi:NADH:ubiquinone oxidoreductase subunit K
MIGFLIYKLVKFKALSLSEMFQWLKMNPNLITVFISVSLMANAILFTIYVNGRNDKTAKGIFIMTMLYAVIALAFKYW